MKKKELYKELGAFILKTLAEKERRFVSENEHIG